MINKCISHPKQIPTTFYAIKSELINKGLYAIYSLIGCMTVELDSPAYKNHLVAAAIYFEHISCFIYKNKHGRYVKPGEEYYRKAIFEGWAESKEELHDRIAFRRDINTISPDELEQFYRMIWLMADIVCPMMACLDEQGFISEYAYSIDYVIRHKGNIERPVMSSLFPKNYDDFKYEEGIAAEISMYHIW